MEWPDPVTFRTLDFGTLQWTDTNHFDMQFINLKPAQLGDKTLSNWKQNYLVLKETG
jgi:hypothetical protein